MDKLKPSQLLRLGAKQVGQCRFRTFVSLEGVVTQACAYGMMVVAKTGSLDFEVCRAFSLDGENVLGEATNQVLNEMVNRNDKQYQTPEEIAQWLESKGL